MRTELAPSRLAFTVLAAALSAACSGSGGAPAPATHAISGTITGGGGVTVDLTGARAATATSDGTGRYAFPALPDGDYLVTPHRVGFLFTPASAAVALHGADAVRDFLGAALHAISGRVSGPGGVGTPGVELSLAGPGGTARRSTTDGAGDFAFADVPDGAYTLTPAKGGLSILPFRTTVTVAGADATGVAFTAGDSAAPGFVAGTIHYAGTRTGRIFVRCDDFVHGASVAGPGPYLLRGFVPGAPCTPSAWMDTVGLGVRHGLDPTGSGSVVAAGGGAAADITLTDPVDPAPVTPGLLVRPLDGALLVGWDVPAADEERATSYRISWGTDAAATSGGTRVVPANGQGLAFLGGLANGSAVYVKLAERVGGVESAPSPAVGPTTVGPAAGGATVSGVVTFPGVATGPLTVMVGPPPFVSGAVKGVQLASPMSPQAFSITGVPDGPAMLFALLDQDGDGIAGPGDLASFRWDTGSITGVPFTPGFTVAGATSADLALSGRGARVHLITQGLESPSFTGYGAFMYVLGEARVPVEAVLFEGAHADVPLDLAYQPIYQAGFQTGFYATSAALDLPPVPGTTYRIGVTYADGTVEDLEGVVERALDFPTALAVDTAAPNSPANPRLSWGPPALAPGGTWGTTLLVEGLWSYPASGVMPPSQTSVVYGIAGGRGPGFPLPGGLPPPLPAGIQQSLDVVVRDDLGNSARSQLTFTP